MFEKIKIKICCKIITIVVCMNKNDNKYITKPFLHS